MSSTRNSFAGMRLITALTLGSTMVSGYAVLTHEAIIDSVWDTSIQKLLLKRFPNSTPDELEKAHAAGAYLGANEAYAKLVGKLSARQFNGMAPELRANILAFYNGASEPVPTKSEKDAEKRKTDWAKLQGQLAELVAKSAESSVSR